MLDSVLQHLDTDQDHAIDRLKQFLAIPSVSTDPAFAMHAPRAADFVADALRNAGLDATIHATPGHPIVLAHTPANQSPPDAPHLLFYGHYDVQPPDPLDEWTSPPFEPVVRDGAIFARGASDDKGQVACFLEALHAWKHAHNRLPIRVTVLIEGEEECGSGNLRPFIESHRKQLTADVAAISDTLMWDPQTVAITYGLRGLLYFDVQLHHTNRDLHSGMYGGTLANPANVLTNVLGRLFDDCHRVTVPGFYDDVIPPNEGERQRWSELGFDEGEFFARVGAQQPHGETGYSTLERKWARPSCDINGLYGGYAAPGAKTIIPAFAAAKVSFRLAPNQDPGKIAEAFTDWLKSHNTHGCRWQITQFGAADPVVVASDSPYITAAAQAIEHCSGHPPVLIREGATIPVVADLKQVLGIDTLLIGFGLAGDRIHAPNENFKLASFTLGCRTYAALLDKLSHIQR